MLQVNLRLSKSLATMNYQSAKANWFPTQSTAFLLRKVLCQDSWLIRSFRPLSGFKPENLTDCVMRLGYRLLFNLSTIIYHCKERVNLLYCHHSSHSRNGSGFSGDREINRIPTPLDWRRVTRELLST